MENRVYFKGFLQDDFQYFLELVLNEKVMVMNYGRVFSLEEAKQSYEYLLKRSKRYEGFGDFKVFKQDTNTFIGSCALLINDDFTKAEIEYLLLPEYWGKGYGSEIVSILLNKIQQVKSVREVTAITDPKNIGSRKILLNNGFKSCKVYEIDDGSLAESFSKEIIHSETSSEKIKLQII